MMEGLFQDGDFQRDLGRLLGNLERLFPEDLHGDPLPFSGDDPLTLQEAMRLMGDMQGLDELEQELLEAVKTNDASQLDSGEIGRLVGEEARRMAEEIQEFTRMLEEAGFIQRKGKEWALTPRAMRRIGERALEDIFGRIDRGLAGEHTLSRYGWGIERLDETKQYAFGDAFALDAQSSVMNALRRDRALPLHMRQDDFEVYRTSSINQCSTVIMVDMSYSMLYRGRFQAARKVALALDSLIRSKFPRDTLHVVAFSYFVLPLEPHMLLDSHWIDPRGTDFPEALRQARAILGKRKGGTKQIIMITDGEPHANSAGWNVGAWSMRQAMEETLREVQRCSRDGITVNTFMLDSEPVMTRFIRTLTKINQGRVFFADPSQLGEYVIVDYVKNRRRAA
ncbi:MAG TPA: VWA domain-containing protein, partial [Chloroflexota bacterium]